MGETKKIDFPEWTPSDWQNESYENKWNKYIVFAEVDCFGDHNPRNDKKYKWVDLYFGFFHDVGCKNITGFENGPAQNFPVISHVRNYGQYNESDFYTYIQISELDFDNKEKLIDENFSDSNFPPEYWTITHENWNYSNTKNAGGEIGEACFSRSPYSTDVYRLISPQISIENLDYLIIEFKHFVDHYYKTFKLKLEISVYFI